MFDSDVENDVCLEISFKSTLLLLSLTAATSLIEDLEGVVIES